MTSHTFVLVHGAWHGGWCYVRVKKLLEQAGHTVFTPSMSGMAEHAHAYSPAINLSTHIQDIAGLIETENLHDIVLVGHSYGGLVITGVADALPDRIKALAYLDAFIGRDNTSTFDLDLKDAVAAHLDRAQSNGGHTVPPIPGEIFGVNLTDRAWVDAKCTPQPFATLAERVRLTGKHETITNRVFIFANGWAGTPFRSQYDSVRGRADWRTEEMACGHDVMVDDPEGTTRILLSLLD